MIELPDVERMIEQIAGYTTGKTISAIRIDDPGVVAIEPKIVTDHLEHHAIDSVERHGRYVLLRFRSDYSLVVDMGDEGLLRLESQTAPATERTRIRLQFAAGRELRFSSTGTTKGAVEVVAGSDFNEKGALESLGVDPLSDDLTVEYFERLAARNNRSSIKGFLLNQKAIAGIGNDYADEICFQAGVRPDMKVGKLLPHQMQRLHRYLRRVLRRATLHWSAAHSDPGWLINSRASGAACPRCRHELISVKVTGRKTVICTRCQRAA